MGDAPEQKDAESLPAYDPEPALSVSDNAPAKHRRLYEIILATQHVEPALVGINAEIEVLREKQKHAQQTLTHTTAAAEREKEGWVKAKESRFDKLFHRKEYTATVKKEEEEYEAAQDWQLRAQAAEKVISTHLEELTTRRNALWKEEKQRKDAKRELLMLYDEVFQGPTAKYPEEDRLEADCAALEKIVQDFESQIWQLIKTNDLVSMARSSIFSAKDLISTATGSTIENSAGAAIKVMIGIADIMLPKPYHPMPVKRRKRHTVNHTGGVTERVRKLLAHADECVFNARQLDPTVLIDAVPVYQIDESSRLDSASRLFNAPLTDIICHRELEDATEAVDVLAGLLVEEDEKCQGRVEAAKAEKKPVKEQLNLANEELFELRTRLFKEELGKPKAVSDAKKG